MLQPLVSVLVPTYNRAGLLAPCLESLLGQTLRPSQVLVVDDGSTDATVTMLASFGSAIQCLRVPQGGKSRAVNAGLSRGIRLDLSVLAAIEVLARQSPALAHVRRRLSERAWYELKRNVRVLAGDLTALRGRDAARTVRRMRALWSQAAVLRGGAARARHSSTRGTNYAGASHVE